MKPKRIQLRRTKGWRKPEDAIVVARPSKWGNPFPVASRKSEHGEPREVAIAHYGEALLRGDLAITVDDVRRELQGHDLCCWCALDVQCHADVLLEVANQPCDGRGRRRARNERAGRGRSSASIASTI
jgi:hypothetical protein